MHTGTIVNLRNCRSQRIATISDRFNQPLKKVIIMNWRSEQKADQDSSGIFGKRCILRKVKTDIQNEFLIKLPERLIQPWQHIGKRTTTCVTFLSAIGKP